MKNLTQGRHRNYISYLPLKTKIRDFNELKIEVSYTLGGHNYFTGSTNPRGYKMYFKPISRNAGMESSILLGSGKESGYYINIEASNRFSAKRLRELAEKYDNVIEDLGDCFETEDKSRLFSIINEKKEVSCVV